MALWAALWADGNGGQDHHPGRPRALYGPHKAPSGPAVSKPNRRRVSYAVAGMAMRLTMARAREAGITARQWRTLSVVLDRTGTYSRVSDRLYLAAIAAAVYRTDKPEPWQLKKISRDLRALARAGVIKREPPKAGRPNVAAGAGWVGLLNPEKGPALAPLLATKRGQSGTEKGPERDRKGASAGPPTEETSEETVYVAPDSAPQHGTHTQSPPSAWEAKKAGPGGWNVRAMIPATLNRVASWEDMRDPGACVVTTALEDALIKVGAVDDDARPRLDMTKSARFDAREICQEVDAWLDDGERVPSFLSDAYYGIGVDE